MNILDCKVPPYIHKVKYGKAIEELYKAKMSEDEEENKHDKKDYCKCHFWTAGKALQQEECKQDI